MENIAHKLKNNQYHAVGELASDFILMFDNAREDDDAVPDVPAAVQELLLTLFTSSSATSSARTRCSLPRSPSRVTRSLRAWSWSSNDDSMTGGAPVQQTQYTKGDFVYIHPDKGNKDPSIVHIERETFHVRTRKFLQQEVFKTDQHRTIPLDQVFGHCYVMNVKEYFKFKPQGFSDKDIYVCESRYNTRHRWFKKIK
ncbi:hypothetical protein OBRU01_14525, partial [Operophtera brumata]